MRSRLIIPAVIALVGTLGAPAYAAPGDVKVSDRAYVRYDGGTDATLTSCSTNNRQQNEPSAAVSPRNPALMVAGANDYCPVPTAGDSWAGLYYSANGGSTWTNSLVPGYPTDTSPAGLASPLHGLVTSAGDPVQAWDNDGHLYYGGIAFNRAKPASGSIWVARYRWNSGSAPIYEHTTLVSRGTPSPIFLGHFEDKVQLEVDRGASSPHAGNVYICWARFTASGPNNGIFLATSSDRGQSFKTQKLSDSIHGNQFCDIAVTRNGSVYVAWRQFSFDSGQGQRDAAVYAKSTNGGKLFSKPAVIAKFDAWDAGDQTFSPEAYGRAKYEACLASDLGPGSCSSPEPRANARDCGDGPLACQSGYVFFRVNSQVRIAADPTSSGRPDSAHVVFDASVPGSAVPTGTTFGTAGAGVGTQASVYLTSTVDGTHWSVPSRVDPQPVGHQFFPDVAADSGRLHVMWQDSRLDGNLNADFRTVPMGNRRTAANPPGSVSAGGNVHAFLASSIGGGPFTVARVSTVGTQPSMEQFGNRDTPFFGDYNYASASGGTVLVVWTDQRDTVLGADPRYPIDGTDGFDVKQCRVANPDGTFGPDTCPHDGGLDQNIYGAVVHS